MTSIWPAWFILIYFESSCDHKIMWTPESIGNVKNEKGIYTVGNPLNLI